MKNLIIKLILWLSRNNDSYQGIDNELVSEWLALQYEKKGLKHYFRKRDLEILKALGTLPEEKNFWILNGQRLELIKMVQSMEHEYKKKNVKKTLKGRKKG